MHLLDWLPGPVYTSSLSDLEISQHHLQSWRYCVRYQWKRQHNQALRVIDRYDLEVQNPHLWEGSAGMEFAIVSSRDDAREGIKPWQSIPEAHEAGMGKWKHHPSESMEWTYGSVEWLPTDEVYKPLRTWRMACFAQVDVQMHIHIIVSLLTAHLSQKNWR